MAFAQENTHKTARSHPARGAWIEIKVAKNELLATGSRTPQGVRGLKFRPKQQYPAVSRRTPQGVRGLK